MSAHPDVALVSRMGRGDSAALGVILERYWPSLVRYASGLLGNRDEAEDVASETFERLWERRDAWRVEGSVLPLLLRIVRNLCLDGLRRRSARERAHLGASPPPAPLTPEAVIGKEEVRDIVTKAVNSLPERRREVLLLVRMQGLSHKDAAAILHIAPQTVANHLKLAMDDIRRLLARYFYDSIEESLPEQTDATA
jgi:RNA polymerase sigma-70 factor (ECF subfamily)